MGVGRWAAATVMSTAMTAAVQGCSGGIKQHEPEFGQVVTRTTENAVSINRCMSNHLIVNAARIDETDDPRYVLWVELEGSTAVHPQTMTIRIDGDEWSFEDQTKMDVRLACPETSRGAPLPGSSQLGGRGNLGCVYNEVYWYSVTPDQLARLGGALSVTIQLHGINGHVERAFSAENLARIREFVVEHVPEAEASSG